MNNSRDLMIKYIQFMEKNAKEVHRMKGYKDIDYVIGCFALKKIKLKENMPVRTIFMGNSDILNGFAYYFYHFDISSWCTWTNFIETLQYKNIDLNTLLIQDTELYKKLYDRE